MSYLFGSTWESAHDYYLTTPPEDDIATTCDRCGMDIYTDDFVYNIDGDIICQDCANDWLKSMRMVATPNMRGDL